MVVALDDKGSQRGLMHHVRSRRDELVRACCTWPDLLLKATHNALGSPYNDEFCDFLADMPEDCLRASIVGLGIEDHYDDLWGKMILRLPATATPRLFESLLMISPMSNVVANFISDWIGAKHDSFWQAQLDRADAGSRHAQEIVKRTIASQIAFGKLPVIVPSHRLSHVELESHVQDDPRKNQTLVEVVWQVTEAKLGKRIATRASEMLNGMTLPRKFQYNLAVFMDHEGLFCKILERWARLPQEALRWPPGFGLTKVEPDFWKMAPADIGVLEITVDPAGRTFPALGVHLKLAAFYHEFEEDFEVDVNGQPDLSAWPDPQQRAYRMLIWTSVAYAVILYATAPDAPSDKPHKKIGLSVITGQRKPVATRFVRLPQGHKRSRKAEKRALKHRGFLPPDGQTFRMSPPIKERQTAEGYDPITIRVNLPEVKE